MCEDKKDSNERVEAHFDAKHLKIWISLDMSDDHHLTEIALLRNLSKRQVLELLIDLEHYVGSITAESMMSLRLKKELIGLP